jgi:pilus assembly protein FimV
MRRSEPRSFSLVTLALGVAVACGSVDLVPDAGSGGATTNPDAIAPPTLPITVNDAGTGAAGTSGAAGTTGVAGTRGGAGSSAVDAGVDRGAAGTRAADGGATGGAGTTGSAGTTGVAGAGVAGATGTAGTRGSAGTTGSAGTSGGAGTTGAAGTIGAGGTTGAAGTGGPIACAPKPNPKPGECWTDDDCGLLAPNCEDARACPCGEKCKDPDRPGKCRLLAADEDEKGPDPGPK